MKRTPHLFSSASAMAERHRTHPWELSALGTPESWDSALKTLVPLMLASNQPMFIVWGPSRTLLYNDAYSAILGGKHPAALGADFLEVWREIRGDLEPIVAAAYRGQPVQMDDILLWMERHGYREETHFSFSYSPVRDDEGQLAGFFCACAEITSQVLAERRLVESEARHRGVLANMGEAFSLFDHEFTILEVNEATTRVVGLPREELVGRSHWEAFPGTFDTELGRMYRAALGDQQPGHLEHLHEFPDGRKVWFEVRAFPVDAGLAVFFRDVTRQRARDREAALAAERVELALDAGAIVGTWVWTVPDNRFIADTRFAASFDLDPAVCQSGLPLEVVAASIHADDSQRVQSALADALARGGPYRCEYRVRHREGGYRWIEANGRVEQDSAGNPIRFPGVLLDIEVRRRAEAERDRISALLRNFIEAVPGVVYAKDLDGRFIMANRGTADLLGLDAADFIGKTDRDVLADPVQAANLMVVDRRVMQSGVAQQVEEWVQRPDGTSALWWSTKAPMLDTEGRVIGLIGSSVDITDRKQSEDALRRSEQRAAVAMEVAQLGTWEWDVDSGHFTVDERCLRMCGLSQAGGPLTLEEIRERVHPDDWPRVENALQRSLEPTGDGIYAEEFRWVHPDGRTVWTASRGTLQRASATEGAALLMLGSVLDVTERRQLVDALKQADQRKDEFLAMLAHELRNPLAPINTAAQMLRLTGDPTPGVARASEIIGRQVGHLTRLVDDLLDVSRVTRGLVELELGPVDVRTVISAATEQVRPLIQSRGHELHTSMAAGPFMVEGDFHRLVQIVSNLLNNAAKYTPQGGRIEVRLGLDEAQVVIEVRDNGVGIATDLLPGVFELFTQAERTPDRAQGGLGIGLALVRSMVQLHHGEIQAASPGINRGSTFTVRLPRSNQRVLEPDSAERASSATSRRRVLVVDDNTDAAETLAEVLQLVGHDVRVAYSALEALALARDGTAWDTFVLDIGLPEMTGYELGRRIRGFPGLESALLIALTGYGQPHDRTIAKAVGFDHHLVKPADVGRLVEILDQGK